jgi:5-bromo-4-chloroindolyl phosphate hydrolysis protein
MGQRKALSDALATKDFRYFRATFDGAKQRHRVALKNYCTLLLKHKSLWKHGQVPLLCMIRARMITAMVTVGSLSTQKW